MVRKLWNILALTALLAAAGCTGSTGTHDPVLTTLDPVRIAIGERKQLTVTAADEDGDDLEFRFQLTLFPDDSARTQPINQNMTLERGMKWIAASSTAIFEWGPSPDHVGEHTLTIVADDGNGGQAEATAAVTVVAGQEQGAPRFDSHPNLVLDLARSDCLKVRVAVDDADSLEVELSLEGAPEGMALKAVSETGKEAELEWCPERDQLEGRNVFTFFAVADDGEHQPVKQRMSVVIKRAGQPGGGGSGPAEGCPQGMSAPTIDPVPISDQCTDEDFVIEAAIRDLESPIADAFVAFSWQENPGDFGCYISAGLFDTEDDMWVGSIPRVSELIDQAPSDCAPIDPTQPVRFYYYLCAWDDDDPGGDQCDNAWCEPDQSQFTFVWSPQCGGAGGGEGQCPDDEHDSGAGNDSRDAAAPIADGEGFSRVLCPDDEDWYRVSAQAGDTLVLGVGYGGEGARLDVQVYGPDGQRAGVQEPDPDPGFNLVRISPTVEGEYTVGVTSVAVGSGGEVYNFIIRREAGGGASPGDCPADAGEPNDGRGGATAIAPGAHGPFGVCGPSDTADWYSFQADSGAAIVADLLFAHRQGGDLDLELWPPGGERRVARSLSASDNERIEFTANASGEWLLGVLGYQGAINTYRLELSVGGEGGDGGDAGGDDGGDPPPDPECASDGGAEPNNTSGEAAELVDAVGCATVQEGDEDWWRVDLEALEGFTADVVFRDADGDIDVELYDSDGTTLLLVAQSVNDDERVVFPGKAAAGPVFMKVILYGGERNTYTMGLIKRAFGLGPVGTCPADHQEPNDSRDAARTVVIREGAGTRRALAWCGDDDWFRLRLPPGSGQLLLGELVFDTGQHALSVELVDQDGNPVGSVTPNGAGRFDIESRHEGNNFLRVTGADPPPGAGLYWFEFVLLQEA